MSVHDARNPCSPSAKSMFTSPGIDVHDTLEWVFTMGWNQCSGSPGIHNLKPDLKISEVSVSNYAGFILPCMAAGASPPAPETVEMVKKALAEGKPVAAQFNAVRTLAKAGVLVDKKYAFLREVDVTEFPDFKGALYAGSGVIQDGNIITSGVCPYAARESGIEHGTKELSQTLAEAIKSMK